MSRFQYRKKPVVIEAVKFNCTESEHTVALPRWLIDGIKSGTVYQEDNTWYCKTLEGKHIISPDDYLIQGIKGELYPCKPDIFEATYEKVE